MQETTQNGKVQTQKIRITIKTVIEIKREEAEKIGNKKTACKSCDDCKR